MCSDGDGVAGGCKSEVEALREENAALRGKVVRLRASVEACMHFVICDCKYDDEVYQTAKAVLAETEVTP
jgi:hypothetical protein